MRFYKGAIEQMKTAQQIKERLAGYATLLKQINASQDYAQYRRLKYKMNELAWVLNMEPVWERLLQKEKKK